MAIRRGASAKNLEGISSDICDFMGRARRDQDGISSHDIFRFAIQIHAALALGKVVNLFGFCVAVPGRGGAWRERGLSQALILDWGIA